LLSEQLNGCSVLLLSVDVVLLFGNEVVSQSVSLLPFPLVLIQNVVVLLFPVLGADFDGQILVLNAAMLDQFGAFRRQK
jgi:hypothetical protein